MPNENTDKTSGTHERTPKRRTKGWTASATHAANRTRKGRKGKKHHVSKPRITDGISGKVGRITQPIESLYTGTPHLDMHNMVQDMNAAKRELRRHEHEE